MLRQLRVADKLLAIDQRRRLRRAPRLLVEQLMHARLRRIRPLGAVPLVQQQLAFGRRQQIDARRRLVKIRRHRSQRLLQIRAVAHRRVAIEQGAGVVQRADNAAAAFRQLERHVEFRDVIAQPGIRRLQARQCDIAHRAVLPGQHHLEQRRRVQLARRIDHLHHLFKRQIAVFPHRQYRLAHAFEQDFQRRLTAQIDMHRQRANEEAGQRFDFQPAAVGLRGTNHHLRLAGHAGQHQTPGGQHRHEQRAAVLAAQPPQRVGERRVDNQRHLAAGERLHRRTRPIGRQRQQRRRIAQRLAPERRLLGQPFLRQPLALPNGIIDIVHRQRRQRRRFTALEGAIQCAQLPHQDPGRPAVGNDMVAGQQEQMPPLAHLQQASPHQRPPFQIERRFHRRFG